jgi:hypothetical protein
MNKRSAMASRRAASEDRLMSANQLGGPADLVPGAAGSRSRSRLEQPHVLHVRERLARVLAHEWFLAGRVAPHREEVVPAVRAEHVELLGEVRALSPRTLALTFAGREVERTSGALAEPFPSVHDLASLPP